MTARQKLVLSLNIFSAVIGLIAVVFLAIAGSGTVAGLVLAMTVVALFSAENLAGRWDA